MDLARITFLETAALKKCKSLGHVMNIWMTEECLDGTIYSVNRCLNCNKQVVVTDDKKACNDGINGSAIASKCTENKEVEKKDTFAIILFNDDPDRIELFGPETYGNAEDWAAGFTENVKGSRAILTTSDVMIKFWLNQ